MTTSGIHPSHEDLFAYRDGELPAERRLLVEAHVVGCQACRKLVDEVSALEASLRQRPDDARVEYFEQLPDAVMERISRGGGSGARAERGGGPVRERRREATLETTPGTRRPRLAWGAIVSTFAAAASVVVVVGVLIQRGTLRSILKPAPVEEAERPRGKADSVGSGLPFPTSLPSMPEADTPSIGTLDAGTPSLPSKDNAAIARRTKPTPAPTGVEVGQRQFATAQEERMARAAPVELGAQREAPAATQGDEKLRAEAIASRAPAAAEGVGGAAAGSPGSPYGAVVRQHRLPLLWEEARVDGATLLRAESSLRALYQSGRAGADSARLRLYLAEAARLRYRDATDSLLYDTVVHHYLRAIRLGRDADPDVVRTARQRLDSFGR